MSQRRNVLRGLWLCHWGVTVAGVSSRVLLARESGPSRAPLVAGPERSHHVRCVTKLPVVEAQPRFANSR